MVKILIVEDSPVMQEFLTYIINSEPGFQIVGVVSDGIQAVEAVKTLKPNVIAMDWQMPNLDGKEATRVIMETNPTPIVIVTGSQAVKDVAVTFSLMEAGALAIVKKPHAINHPDYKNDVVQLVQTLKLMSEIKVVRRFTRMKREFPGEKPILEKPIQEKSKIKIVAIGASTGGPIVLQKILSGLPRNFPFPLMIVQHISPGFVEGFVEWLSKTTNFPLHVAKNGDVPLPGHGYVAPDSFHMGVDGESRIILSNHPPENGLRPSVAFLFRTVAVALHQSAVGILLTGMGRDGAAELKLMKDNGAITIAQDQESSVVFGMPGEAVSLKATTHILNPDGIVSFLSTFVENNKK